MPRVRPVGPAPRTGCEPDPAWVGPCSERYATFVELTGPAFRGHPSDGAWRAPTRQTRWRGDPSCSRPTAGGGALHGHLRRRPPGGAGPSLPGSAAERRCRIGPRTCAPPARATRSGSSTGRPTRRWDSTRWPAAPRTRRPWRRSASTRCGRGVGTRRPGWRTWTWAASGRRSTSRRRSPASAVRSTRGVRRPDLGLACVRAYNDWYLEEWVGAHPERFVPMGITYLADPELGAAEIRRNAERGFTAVSLPEQPQKLGYPTLHSGWWDPVVRACADTGTVICLHVGSSGITSDVHADGRTAGGVHRHPVLVAVPPRLHRLAVVGLPAAVPRSAHRHERGRPGVGADAGRPTRLHPRGVRSRPPGLAVRCGQPRGPGRRPTSSCATSGSARWTTRRSGPYATASAWTTS